MARFAPFGLVLQAKWVFIGSAITRVNMSASNRNGVDYEWCGKDYKVISQRDNSPVVEEIVEDTDMSEEDQNSLYSQHSLDDSGDEFETNLKGKSDNVLEQYRAYKHFEFDNPINTSDGLKEVVFKFETGGQPASNTHVLFRDKSQEDSTYSFVQLNTANAVTLYLKRFLFVRKMVVRNNYKSKGNVHTEMALLHDLTGGNADDIAGILTGYKLVVDKPVCADCYPFVKLAAPDEVDDSTDFFKNGPSTRESWSAWSNPFK